MDEIKQGEGVYYISLWKQPPHLNKVIDSSLQNVWIVNHYPIIQADRWWKCQTQIKENGAVREVLLREMFFDIQMGTAEFLEVYEDFSGEGIILFQLNSPVPPSLFFHKIKEENNRQKILLKNGITIGIEFPISNDIGFIWSVKKEYLEKLLGQREICDLLRT